MVEIIILSISGAIFWYICYVGITKNNAEDYTLDNWYYNIQNIAGFNTDVDVLVRLEVEYFKNLPYIGMLLKHIVMCKKHLVYSYFFARNIKRIYKKYKRAKKVQSLFDRYDNVSDFHKQEFSLLIQSYRKECQNYIDLYHDFANYQIDSLIRNGSDKNQDRYN